MNLKIPVAAIVLSGATWSAAAELKALTRYAVPDNEGLDYITIDSVARRIYVAHSVRINVLNVDTGAVAGTIEDTPGVHGIAIAGKLKHGFTSNG
jgi:hypothetical protein